MTCGWLGPRLGLSDVALLVGLRRADGRLIRQARAWLAQRRHQDSCQCHRCLWSRGVISLRIRQPFAEWRAR